MISGIHHHRFRFYDNAGLGLHIVLIGHAYTDDGDGIEVRTLAEDIERWVEPSLIQGIELVRQEINRSAGSGRVTIEFSEVLYAIADVQPEGAAVAALLWCAEYFEFDPPQIYGSYDEETNRYRFTLAESRTELLVDVDFRGRRPL